jgi:hypothetical protein
MNKGLPLAAKPKCPVFHPLGLSMEPPENLLSKYNQHNLKIRQKSSLLLTEVKGRTISVKF